MDTDNSVHPSSLSVDLPAIFSSASAQELLTKPVLRALMVEYWCWEQGMADWYARQPVRPHRDFAGWIVEDGRYSTGSTSSNSSPASACSDA